MNNPSFIWIVFIICLLVCTLSLGFKPQNSITWKPCPESLELRQNFDLEVNPNLDDFKKWYFTNYVHRAHKTNQFNIFDAKITANVPKDDEHWRKLLQTLQSAECTTVNFPFLWNEPNDPRFIQFFVKRYKARTATPKGVLFLIQGGPGAGGSAGFDSHIPSFKENLKDEWDILIPDQRGTGRSSFLSCGAPNSLYSENPKEIESCMSEIFKNFTKSDLYGWSTRQAAEDIHAFSNLYKISQLVHNLNFKNLENSENFINFKKTANFDNFAN